MELKTVYDVRALGLRIAKYQSNGETIVHCPYHDDGKASASYNQAKDLFYCFGCHESSDAEKLVQETGGELVPVSSSLAYESEDAVDTEWRRLLLSPLAFKSEYLAQRQVTADQIEKYQIRERGNGDIIFPLKNKFGDIIGVQIRQLKRQPKYIFQGERPTIWPYENLYTMPGPLFIVEGVFGVLRLRLLGKNAVAILGSGSVREAAELIRGTQHRPIVYMDGDFPGLLAAGKFALLDFPSVGYWKIPADELEAKHTKRMGEHGWQLVFDVNHIIEQSDKPARLTKLLKKFYKGLAR